MTSTPRHFRIFLSSPGDVARERQIARKVIAALPDDPLLRGRITTQVIAWEDPRSRTAMLATLSPQEAIDRGMPKPADCNIVIVILWSRMGTPLDPNKYRKPDGSAYLSGTEWEYENAMEAARRTGKPLVLVYRRTDVPEIKLNDPERKEKIEQYERVEAFFARFRNPDGTWKQSYAEYAKPNAFQAFLENDLKSLIAPLLTAAPPPPAKPLISGSPFPGLRPFMPADEPLFFGRGRETDELVSRVARDRFVAVVGASGSGKSSLVGAGLIPALINQGALDGSKDWTWLRFTPGGLGDNPFLPLAAELKNFTEAHGWSARQIADKLAVEPNVLDEIAAAALTDKPDWAELLLFIDQFEELFTLVKPEHIAPFAAFLNAAAASKRVRVVVTMRSDFYHRCVDVPGLVGLLQSGSYPLGVPDAFALLEMIERPAERAGLSFEADLPKRIVRDTGDEPGGLALMAYTLDELYERCKGKQTLTAADYEALGGVQGAIGTRAENTFARLDAEAQGVFAHVFRDLLEVDERGTATRQRASLSRFTGNCAAFVSAFVEARLLTASADQHRLAMVEMAHEALLRKWGRLAEWIEATQDDLRLLRQMRLAAQEWEASGHKRGYLWIGERGEALATMLKRLQPDLNPIERLFARREADHLLDEIEDAATSDQRRFAIGERLSIIGDPRRGVGLRPDGLPDIEWLLVPGGRIALKNEKGKLLGDFDVLPFHIAKYPVTYVQFQAFLDARGDFSENALTGIFALRYHKQGLSEQNQKFASYPRDNVSWSQALEFCQWLNEKLPLDALPHLPFQRPIGEMEAFLLLDIHRAATESTVRLPTEWEWQMAATGGNADSYFPWGAEWRSECANTSETGIGRTCAVGMFPRGEASSGALDMAGNVWEWCLNEYKIVKNVSLGGTNSRALRGGASSSAGMGGALCWSRRYYGPLGRHNDFGFRLVVAAAAF